MNKSINILFQYRIVEHEYQHLCVKVGNEMSLRSGLNRFRPSLTMMARRRAALSPRQSCVVRAEDAIWRMNGSLRTREDVTWRIAGGGSLRTRAVVEDEKSLMCFTRRSLTSNSSANERTCRLGQNQYNTTLLPVRHFVGAVCLYG